MQRTSFEEYFAGNLKAGIIDFFLRASVNPDGEVVEFYIHPASHAGQTPEFQVSGNTVKQINVTE